MSSLARAWVEAGPFLRIGWDFVVSLGVFGALGWWLDKKLGSAPYGLLAGSVGGVLIGFAAFWRTIVRLDQRQSLGKQQSPRKQYNPGPGKQYGPGQQRSDSERD